MIFFFLFLLLLDIASKSLAAHFMPAMPVFDFSGVQFSIDYATNTGMAWSLLSGYPGLLFLVRIVVIGVIAGYLFFKRAWTVPLGLIVTGAIGNAIDYCLYGHVIDFIHFTFWGYSYPIFNIADSCITIGALLFILGSRESKSIQRI